MAPLQHRPCERNTIGRHCWSIGASSEEPQATRLRSRHTLVCELEAGHDCCTRWYPDRSSRLLASPSPVRLRENRMRTHSFAWALLATYASEFGSETQSNDSRRLASHLRSRSRFWLPKPIKYKNGSAAFEAAPKSPF